MAAGLLAASCARPVPSSDPGARPVLKVEDRILPVSQWERFRASKMQTEQEQDEVQLFDLFVEQEIFLFLADRDRVAVTDQEVRQSLAALGLGSAEDLKNEALLRSVGEDLRVQKWIKTHISSKVQVSVKEAEAYYRQNAAQFQQPEMVHLREILVADPVFAGKLYRQLKKEPAEEFLKAARKYSTAPNASSDGELGAFARGTLPEEFDRAVFRLRPGEISAPVKSDLGYHLFLLEERIRRRRQRFAEVQDQIFERILADKESEAIRSHLESAKKNLKVQIYRENVKLTERKEEPES